MPQAAPISELRPHRLRGYAKLAGSAAIFLLALYSLTIFVEEELLNDLRHELTLPLVLMIVVAINVAAFLFFTLVWKLYRWIKRDLDPGED